jgi:hypothetical protein
VDVGSNNIMTHPNKIQSVLLGTLIILLSACNSNDQKAFQQTLSVKFDTLQVDNTKDTLVFGSKGTGLFFEKESFELPDGTIPKGKISIQLKECYSNSDIVRENLATTSNGKLIETRGMINVLAFSDDQELKLKQGKKFIIHFPKDSTDGTKQMNLFYANNNNGSQTIDWKLDSITLLKPTAYMSGWMTTGYVGGDTSGKGGFYFKGQKEEGIYDYFYKNFDNSKLQATREDLQNKLYEAAFIVTKQGNITNIKITEEIYDTSGKRIPSTGKPDPYFYKYMNQIPTLEPFYMDYGNGDLRPFDAKCSFYISMGLFPPDYRNNESYNRVFNQKYNAFKNNAIESMNEAELNFYIFSSSKLGWINCDFFWETKDEKIDYIVKADPQSKPNIKLVFKKAKSILTGTLDGDKYIFKNVPINQDIKIVAITFKGSKPLLSISLTKTGKQIFDKFDYKDFALTDLEKQLNTP